MGFRKLTQVRFADVDPAALVFYPRYFEMLNAAVEDWFAAMGNDFRSLHVDARIGVPTVKLECEFVAPSQLGDELVVIIEPGRISRSSCHYRFRFSGTNGERVRGSAVLVCMDMNSRASMPWPDALRSAIEASMANVTGE